MCEQNGSSCRFCGSGLKRTAPPLFQADAASDKELCEALRLKLDRMKGECDKLATQLGARDETHALLLKKYQLLKQELHEGVRKPHVFLVLPCFFFYVKLDDWWRRRNTVGFWLKFLKNLIPINPDRPKSQCVDVCLTNRADTIGLSCTEEFRSAGVETPLTNQR